MVRIIAAISLDRVIGVYRGNKGRLPWKPDAARGDLRRFHELTEGSTVVMGRRTWQSLRTRPLRNRENFVLSSTPLFDIPFKSTHNKERTHCFPSLSDALDMATHENVWLIGGHDVFVEGLRLPCVREVDLTVVPVKVFDESVSQRLVYFPAIDNKNWKKDLVSQHPINDQLRIIKYRRVD